MKEITYVTGNKSKILSAKSILEPLNIKVNNIKIELTEIQADTTEEVAIYKAKEASEKLKCNVLVNDIGLFIDALNGTRVDYYKTLTPEKYAQFENKCESIISKAKELHR